MPIKLFDTLARQMRELQPGDPDGVFRFYNCGPTVWASAHIGNFRTAVVNDVLRRMLELEFPGKVKHVRNLTDVDDRTISQARAEKRPLAEITRKWTRAYHADCQALNCLAPHVEPTATAHIAEQVDMIEVLMQKGNAYRAADGSVYFKIASFPDYGALSRIKERELKVTNTVFDADHKDDVGDFALWKAYKPEDDGDVKWAGPEGAGAGRPGWHIECSAMIKKHLGETIDLHTGGVDLLFPHHENEIAQSQCCNGTTFSRHWYHSEHLLVDGTTMSKSKGNYYTLSDLVEKGYAPMAVRYALLAAHPRKQMNFMLDSLHAAESALKALRRFAAILPAAGPGGAPVGALRRRPRGAEGRPQHPRRPGRPLHGHQRLRPAHGSPGDRAAFEKVLYAFGFDLVAGSAQSLPPEVDALAKRRWEAKMAKDFAVGRQAPRRACRGEAGPCSTARTATSSSP